jgi:class 3 adenylate cyclase
LVFGDTFQKEYLWLKMRNDQNTEGIEKEVVILLSDMVGYSCRANEMTPAQIQSFMLDYHRNLKAVVESICGPNQLIEPSAGDGAVAVFEFGKKDKQEVCNTAINCALEILYEMAGGLIPKTRIGLFSGNIIEAILDEKVMRFGASFSVASRLEELCTYFGTSLLMGREVANLQTNHKKDLTSIGKITPKNFSHPIHIFSVYKAGIHGCPNDASKEQLHNFVRTKNEAVELFCGNLNKNIDPDFPLARQKLIKAQKLFEEISGEKDLATERLLQYIRNNPCPDEAFNQVGMKIWDRGPQSSEVHLPGLSSELLKSSDPKLYQTLIEETDWENKFRLIWRKKGELIFQKLEKPDGIYFIDKGSVAVIDKETSLASTLYAGDIFGEMAYFSPEGVRTATITAKTDIVLRRISWEDLDSLPVIKGIFQKISQKRKNIL